jgi:hypothetical protein
VSCVGFVVLVFVWVTRSWFPVTDIVQIEKSGDAFRLLYDTKGRYTLTPASGAETTVREPFLMLFVLPALRQPVVTTSCVVRFNHSSSCAVL